MDEDRAKEIEILQNYKKDYVEKFTDQVIFQIYEAFEF